LKANHQLPILTGSKDLIKQISGGGGGGGDFATPLIYNGTPQQCKKREKRGKITTHMW
jgi:hypothetical protein